MEKKTALALRDFWIHFDEHFFSLAPYRNMLVSHRADNFSEMGLMHNKHNTLNTQSTTMAIIPQGSGSSQHFLSNFILQAKHTELFSLKCTGIFRSQRATS